MEPLSVAILDDYQDVALTLAPWDRLGPDVRVDAFTDHLLMGPALIDRLQPYDAIVAMRERTPFGRTLVERLPKLRLLVTTGMRNAAIDAAACRECGIVVCGTDLGGAPTAELAWGLLLALVRSIPHEDRATRDGAWQTTLGPTLAGKTLGVLGLGRQGAKVTAVARAFEMRVIAWSQNMTAGQAREHGAERVEKAALFEQADVVSIHVVLSDRTRGLVGRAELGAMKPTAYFVNTSRGPIVDEAALVETLRAGRIAGAALDVFDTEPLPRDHVLRALSNTVITPHLGYVSIDNYRTAYAQALENIEAWVAGAPVRVIT